MSDNQANGPQAPGGGEDKPAGQGSLLPVVGTAKNEKPGKKGRPWLKPLLIGLGILALVIGVPWGLSYWHYSQTHVSTDDAYVTGNLISVSPIISGTLLELNTDEGYAVRRGQLLARLDDSGPRSAVRQAQANYSAALSQIPQAERNLIYQRQSTEAGIQKARAALEAQRAKTSGAAQQVALTAGTTTNQIRQARAQETQAAAQAQQSAAQVQSAQASLANYQQAVQTALAALDNYRQQVVTAERAAAAADARVAAAQSELDRAANDEARYRVLYDQDAVAAQVFDNARAQARSARANLDAAQSQADEAHSQVEQARAGVRQAQSQVEQARKSVSQAEAQVRAAQRAENAAREQINVARAGVGLALANSREVGIQQANLITTSRQTGESQADISTAQAGREQVATRRLQVATARAQAEQARAALTNAQITLADTYIYAPTDGTVVRKVANVGASMAPGSPIVTMTVGDYVWVDANFKETQLADVRPGQPAEIEVDAFPGKIFKGTVRSINEATGAATSLLPPENATGNFTKIVQRIPVRIELVAAKKDDDPKYATLNDIHNLRQGMSVTATIATNENPKNAGQTGATGAAGGSGVQGTPGMGSSADGGSQPMGAAGPTGAPTIGSQAPGGTTGGPMSGTGSGGQSMPQPGGANQGAAGAPPPLANPGAGPLNPSGSGGSQNPPPSSGPGAINNGPAIGTPNISPSPGQGGFGSPGSANPGITNPGGAAPGTAGSPTAPAPSPPPPAPGGATGAGGSSPGAAGGAAGSAGGTGGGR